MVKPWHAEVIEWDDGNAGELAAHGVSPIEVEEVFMNAPTWLPNRKHRAGDWKMVGRTGGGRALTIILSFDEDRLVLRPITGWDATRADHTRYLGGAR